LLYRRQYPIAHNLWQSTTEVVDRWLREGKIMVAPQGCLFNNPLTVVPKKDAKGLVVGVRPCLDLRQLNKALIGGDHFNIPNIRAMLELLGGNLLFEEFDL